MTKLISKALVLFVVIFVVLAFSKNMIAKAVLENGVRFVTGLALDIRHFDMNLSKTSVDVKDLTLLNPRNFPDRVMVNAPKIYVDYNLSDFLKGNVHLEELRIHLKELVVVKNEKGELNLNSLKAVEASGTHQEPQEKEKGKGPKIQIDLLELKIGKVIYKDYSKAKQPFVKEFNINLDQKYRNIRIRVKLIHQLLPIVGFARQIPMRNVTLVQFFH